MPAEKPEQAPKAPEQAKTLGYSFVIKAITIIAIAGGIVVVASKAFKRRKK